MKDFFLTFSKLIVLLGAMSFAVVAHSQTSVVGGRVLDGNGGTPMSYINCVLLHAADSSLAYGAVTDDRGVFKFAAVDTGAYLLRVSAVGYATAWRGVDVVATAKPTVGLGDIELLANATVLDAVKVSAQRPIYSADGEKVFYHVGDDPSVQTGSASDALQNAPGVEVDAEGNVRYRGSSDVVVWLNDRPSHLDGEALKQYLKLLPAGTIERIEVVSNPSARYNSSKPVINIVTNQKAMMNSLLCLGFYASTMPVESPWASYVYSNERLTVNAWGGVGYSRNNVKVKNEQQYYDSAGMLSGDESYGYSSRQRSPNANAGFSLNYDVDSVTTLNAWAGGWWGVSKQDYTANVARHEYVYAPGDYSFNTTVDSRTPYGGSWFGGSLSHKLDTLGQRLELSLSGNLNANGGKVSKERDFLTMNHLDHSYISETTSGSLWTELELNYVKPYSKDGQVELGVDAEYMRERDASVWDTLSTIAGRYVRDDARTHTYISGNHNVNGYVTLQHRFGPLTAKAGARLYREWKSLVFSDLAVPTAQYDVDAAFWSLVPSLHLSYSTQSGHSLTLSYTRRFTSPEAESLTSFVDYREDDYITGNPLLRPSFSHNLEGGWTFYKQWCSLGLSGYLRANTDEVQNITDVAYSPFFGRMVSYIQPRNIGNSHTYGGQLNATWRPKPFVNIRFNANVFSYGYTVEYRPGEVQDTSMLALTSRLNVWAKLGKTLQLFANANYSSRSLSLMTVSKPSLTIDLGCSADFFDRRLSLFFNVSDILHTARFGSQSLNPYYGSNMEYTYNSTSASIGLTWRIGKMELEGMARSGASTGNAPSM